MKYKQVTLKELLDSREQRAAHQRELLSVYGSDGGVLVSVTLNIPGPVKDKPAYRKALKLGMKQLTALIPKPKILYSQVRELATGPEGYLVLCAMTAAEVKKLAIEVEDGSEVGRLFDMDVMDKSGSVGRSDLGVQRRKCLLCEEDAKVCSRSQRHQMNELLEEIDRRLTAAGIETKGDC